jgi:hypothetical protein
MRQMFQVLSPYRLIPIRRQNLRLVRQLFKKSDKCVFQAEHA